METELETKRRFTAQLPGNLISNIVYFLVSIAIGILLVPYFISTLGIAAYGLIPLASSITGYVAIVVQSLNSTVSRFLTIDLQKNDYWAANRTFNTAFYGLSFVIALMIPIVLIVAYYIPTLFNVPAGEETSAIILFVCACLAFFIRSLNGTFTVQLFAYNRLDLINAVNLVNLLFQVGLTVLLFWQIGPSLVFVGVGYLGGAIVASTVAILLAKRVCPHLHLSTGSFDRSRVKDIGGMGSWVFINQIGALLFLQIDLIVVNILFGATAAGEYSIVLIMGNQLRSIAGVLSGVITPVILTFYAKDHIETMIRVTRSAVKLMGLSMALPIGLVCGFAPQILTVWVGAEYAFLAPLMILLSVHLIINLAVFPLFSINTAYNMVRLPGIITLILGVVNFVLAVILSLFTGWGYYGVAAAGAIVLTFKNAFFTPWYAAKVLGIGSPTFTRALLPGLIAGLLVGVIAVVLGIFFPLSALTPLLIAMMVLSLLYCIFMWRIGLSADERNLFGSYLPEKIRRLVV
jgi:O-antigen/teichoic acid export membrane protein